MQPDDVVGKLRSLGTPEAVKGMARFGVHVAKALGVSAPNLRRLAREIGKDHDLAGRLWKTGIHDARILAALIDEPAKVTPRQMECWAGDFDSWAVCDAACGCLFDKTPYAAATRHQR
jgi:3-methyladenine DNA glycosylase AlkD